MADTYKVAPMPPTLEELTELLQMVKAKRDTALSYLLNCFLDSDNARNTALALQALQEQIDRLEREIDEISRKPKPRAASDVESEISRLATQLHDERPDRGPRGYM